jgi:hypothetical protein
VRLVGSKWGKGGVFEFNKECVERKVECVGLLCAVYYLL